MGVRHNSAASWTVCLAGSVRECSFCKQWIGKYARHHENVTHEQNRETGLVLLVVETQVLFETLEFGGGIIIPAGDCCQRPRDTQCFGIRIETYRSI